MRTDRKHSHPRRHWQVLALVLIAALWVGTSRAQEHEEEHDPPGSTAFVLDLCLSIFFVLFGGLMSGLTIGLLSLSPLNLKLLIKAGTPSQQKYASAIFPLVQRHHLLLVTLLLANAAAMEALPIFLDRLVPSYLAILISVTAVLLFGEVIPQAICSRYGLAIGYYCSWPVRILMGLFFIVAWPIAKLLDLLLGHDHATFFRRAELRELVSLHGAESGHHDSLTVDEVAIITGALDLKYKTVKDAMTPLDRVFMLEANEVLNKETLHKILESGHSRVPVYDGNVNNIIGLLLVKHCLLVEPGTPVRAVVSRTALEVDPEESLYDVLNEFQTGRSHLAIVRQVDVNTARGTVIGIITLEDVIEEILQEEILDESDIRRTARHQRVLRESLNVVTARRSFQFKRSPSMYNAATRRSLDIFRKAHTVSSPTKTKEPGSIDSTSTASAAPALAAAVTTLAAASTNAAAESIVTAGGDSSVAELPSRKRSSTTPRQQEKVPLTAQTRELDNSV